MINKCLSIALTCLFLPAVAKAQDIPFIKAAQLEQWKNADTDTIYVINFWATWCAPCVAELPEFEKLQHAYAGQKVQVILVSTDFKKQVELRVKPFVQENIQYSRVVFMDESNPNNWIDRVQTDWSGLIPATLIIAHRKNYAYFHEGALTFEELEAALQEAL
ncbi:MAG: TlpA family protein disulfide reductase [Saprospiraceae bacterium]